MWDETLCVGAGGRSGFMQSDFIIIQMPVSRLDLLLYRYWCALEQDL